MEGELCQGKMNKGCTSRMAQKYQVYIPSNNKIEMKRGKSMAETVV